MKTFSKKQAIKFGWQIMKKNFLFFATVLIIAGFLNSLFNFLTESVGQFSQIGSGIVQLIGGMISIIITMGFINISLKFHDNEKPRIVDLFSCYPLFFKYFFGLILYAIIVILGLFLFIIPGIILAIRFYFFNYLIIDKKIKPVQALKQSFILTRKNTWNLFSFFLVVLLLFFPIIFASLLMFVGSYSLSPGFIFSQGSGLIILVFGLLILLTSYFVVTPILMVSWAFVYRKLIDSEKLNQENLKVDDEKLNH
jgi:hypothetical protein